MHFRSGVGFLLWLTFTLSVAAAAEPTAIPLWPGAVPGESGTMADEQDLTKPTDNVIAGRRLIRLGNVSRPTLTRYPAPAERANGASVLVLPGGGYHILAWDLEGTEVCEWLNSIGVHAFLLKYRVPRRAGMEKHAAPLQDAQRALGLIRQQAAAWGVDTQRLGVLGFSAGGHLAAALSTQKEGRTYPVVDAADHLRARPDFTVLVYPGYLTVKEEGDQVAADLTITSAHPPTFLVMTQDDGVRVENVLHYYQALHLAKVPAELHVYPKGGHGYGLRRTELPVTTWPDRVADWMKASGWLQATKAAGATTAPSAK